MRLILIKSLIQLVPFGIDENSRVISGFYIANTGYSCEGSSSTAFDYVVGYFEKASKFTDYKPVAKILFIEEWDSSQGTLALMQNIFSKPGTHWWNIGADDELMHELSNAVQIQAIEIFKQRAIEDKIFVEITFPERKECVYD